MRFVSEILKTAVKCVLPLVLILGVACPASAAGATVTQNGSTLIVRGTQRNDHLVVEQFGSTITISCIGLAYDVLGTYDAADIKRIRVFGLGGDDTIENRGADVLFFAYGGRGNDDLYGADLPFSLDVLRGGPGDDQMFGLSGPDVMLGGPGNDYMAGADFTGNDVAASTMNGGSGYDVYVGTPLDDVIVAEDGELDFIDCNGGDDFADPSSSADDFDVIINCAAPAIEITAALRDTFSRATYSGNGPPPPYGYGSISELDVDEDSTTDFGAWDGSVNAGILGDFYSPNGTNPITTSASHVSDIEDSGGSVDIDLFSDSFWGNQPSSGSYPPYGFARSNSSYNVRFVATEESTLTLNGFISANKKSSGQPGATVWVKVIHHGATDTEVFYQNVNPTSSQQFNDLVEEFDGTTVNLVAGETYSFQTYGYASPQPSVFSGNNAEAEISLTWSVE